jgi:hypothetical protein
MNFRRSLSSHAKAVLDECSTETSVTWLKRGGLCMAGTTIVFGIILIVLGLVSYVGTDAVSVTALIPAMFGAVLGLLGWLGLNERYRKHALHVATVVGVVGFLGSARGLAGLIDLITGTQVERPAAVVSQSVMAGLTAVFVGMCLKSFVEARRRRGNSR